MCVQRVTATTKIVRLKKSKECAWCKNHVEFNWVVCKYVFIHTTNDGTHSYIYTSKYIKITNKIAVVAWSDSKMYEKWVRLFFLPHFFLCLYVLHFNVLSDSHISPFESSFDICGKTQKKRVNSHPFEKKGI